MIQLLTWSPAATATGVLGPTQLQLSGLSTQVQTIATVLVLVGLAGAWLVIEAASERLRDAVGDRAVETMEVLAFTGLVAGATALLLVVWDAVGQVEQQLGRVAEDELLGVRIVVSVLFLATAYGVTRVVRHLINRSRVAAVSTDHRREVAYHVVQVTAYAVAGLLILAVWRVNLANLLIGAGVLGVVLGLAARQTLGAVIAGFVLLFARPFQVGDWVEIGGREGIVEDVTIVNTRVRTFDDEQVMIPNDRVTGSEIVNRTREGRLRGTVEVGVDYETDVGEAVAVAERAMEGVDAVLERPAPRAVGDRFDDSAIVLELQFWIGDPSAERMWSARTAVVKAVREAYEHEGIDIPFPQRTVGARDGVEFVAGDARAARPAADGGASGSGSGDGDGDGDGPVSGADATGEE